MVQMANQERPPVAVGQSGTAKTKGLTATFGRGAGAGGPTTGGSPLGSKRPWQGFSFGTLWQELVVYMNPR